MQKVQLQGRMKEFSDELDQDIRITQINLTDKALTRSSIAAKWLRYGFQQQKRKRDMLKMIDELKQKFTKALYQKKRQALQNRTMNEAMLKLDVQRCLKKSSQYMGILAQLKQQDQIIRFVSEAKQIVHAFSYDVRNSIDIMKIENGN